MSVVRTFAAGVTLRDVIVGFIAGFGFSVSTMTVRWRCGDDVYEKKVCRLFLYGFFHALFIVEKTFCVICVENVFILLLEMDDFPGALKLT